MKKSNLITLIVLLLAVVAVLIFAFLSKSNENENTTLDSTEYSSTQKSESDPASSDSSEKSDTTAAETQKATLSDALFIGDSRTVGIMEYALMSEAGFFCDTGMSVFNVKNKRLSVPGVGKVTLDELLSNKKYGKIYIMLGINELGYNFSNIISEYSSLVDYVEKKQPGAHVIIQANLHVTKTRSDSDKVINNASIDKLNSEIKKIAEKENRFYIDPNTLFDDAQGALDSSKTQDNAHLYAKYYAQWGEWIKTETAKYIKEG